MRIFRLFAILALMFGFTAACGDDDSSSAGVGDGGTTEVTDGQGASGDEEAGDDDPVSDDDITSDYSVYFLDDNNEVRVGYARSVKPGAPGKDILQELLAGPNGDDESLGLSTAIPEGTELRSLDIAGNIATVDLSEDFTAPGDEPSGEGRLAQIVYTLTQFPTVDQVELLVNGQVVDSLGDTGVTVSGNLTRADFEFEGAYPSITPMVLIELPRPGDTIVDTGADVSGSAFTFEAAIYLEVLDGNGDVIVPEVYFMGDRSEGMQATFSLFVGLDDAEPGPLTIRMFDNSAEDGSRVGITEVPINFAG